MEHHLCYAEHHAGYRWGYWCVSRHSSCCTVHTVPNDDNPNDDNVENHDGDCATRGNLRGRAVSAVSMRPPSFLVNKNTSHLLRRVFTLLEVFGLEVSLLEVFGLESI
jgi:hypothetical protein